MKHFALGRLPKGQRNRLEAEYEALLESQKREGSVLWYMFEAWKFKLAENTSYRPDFIVLRNDGTIEAHEVKGFWQDDARAKIKVAAALHPVRFFAVKKRAKAAGGGWEYESF